MLWWGKVDLWIYFVKNWLVSILWLITFLVLGNCIRLFYYKIFIYRLLLSGVPSFNGFCLLAAGILLLLVQKKNQGKDTHTV